MDALQKLGIDGWGILLYVVNFGILFYLLKRFVYVPLAKMLDERRNRIQEDVEQATKIREALKAERATEAATRKERLDELDQRIKDAKTVAREEAKRMLTEAEEQRDAILSQATKAADATIAATMADSEAEILKRIRRVVTHVLEEGIPEDVVKTSVDKSWKSISNT